MRMGVLLAAVAAILLLVSSAAAQPTLTVNITSFLNNDPVAVTLSGVTTPTINDSVGVFLASAFEPDVYRPLKCASRRCTGVQLTRPTPCPTGTRYAKRCLRAPLLEPHKPAACDQKG